MGSGRRTLLESMSCCIISSPLNEHDVNSSATLSCINFPLQMDFCLLAVAVSHTSMWVSWWMGTIWGQDIMVELVEFHTAAHCNKWVGCVGTEDAWDVVDDLVQRSILVNFCEGIACKCI